jgi:hypothetical protein
MPKPKRLVLKLSAAALLLLAGGWLALRLAFPPFVPPPLPQPNGYDDLLRAAEMLAPRTGFYSEMEPAELAAVVEINRPALKIARESLEKEIAVPLDWSADETWLGTVHLPQMGKPREVARALAAEALLAHRNGDSQSAIEFGFDNIRLGQAAAKGGLNLDWLVGHAVYGLGLQILRDEVGQLSRADCEALLKQVLALKPTFEPPSELIDRERAFYHATHGAIDSFMMRTVQSTQLKQSLTQLEITDTIYSVRKEILQTHLAIRLYRLDEDRLPESLDELVPKYLPSVPQDPFATGPLIYRLSDEGYVLYSVGANRQDDGGIEQDSSGRVDVLLQPREASVSENQ